ncbi:hypothetical protein [Sphingomonas sp.]|uniref:hypothetical protein n=1 Tax=Sphingomonas sp. TaxID=28214 RepID=UPI003B005763
MLARGQAAPLRFLVTVVLLWVAVRGASLEGWRPFAPARLRLAPPPGWLMGHWPVAAAAAATPPPARLAAAAGPATARVSSPRATPRPAPAPKQSAPNDMIREGIPMDVDQLRLIAVNADQPTGERSYVRETGIAHAAEASGVPDARAALPRWSGSAWAFLRGGGHARPLSSDGQIGGGQAGARALYRLDSRGRIGASARLSRTIDGPRQAEAAVGVDWRPLPALPVHLMAERRVALDRGGRDAFAIGAAGGAYDVRLADGWRLDGYAEAGVVGAKRRDLYADGALRGGRELGLGDGRTLTLGAGLWGAAQPHAARIDVGPSAVVRLPVEDRTVAVALDYRARLAGDARPHSGVALTIGVDF